MAAEVIRAFAPAKINLTLHITGKRDDGYHLLESLVVFARDVGDHMTFAPASDLSLTVTGPLGDGVPTDGQNLILKAAELLRSLRDVTTGAAITLDKHLPHGGGIGGGSSDAATTLKSLAQLWNVAPLTSAEALTLGADLPVCLCAPAPTLMSGIGEILQTAPALPHMWLVLVNPNIHIATGDIFDLLSEAFGTDNPPMDALPDPMDIDSYAIWQLEQRNDLTRPAAEIAPEIVRIMSEFWAIDDYVDCDMSGSGSTCWGLFETQQDAENAAKTLRQEFPDYWIKTTAIS